MTRVTVWLGHLLIVVAAGIAAVFALNVLAGAAPPVHVALPRLFPFAAMSLSVDGLSAFFLLVIVLVTVAAAIYGPSYLGAHAKGPVVQTLALDVFVGCMALVCCAGDALTFLLAWEGMTLASYVLVVSDTAQRGERARGPALPRHGARRDRGAPRRLPHARGARRQASTSPALRAAARGLDGSTRTALFMLALAGFGAKAGVVPLHVWLPKAHPAAPSHVSALMSGVMLKVALYGIFRFGFDLLAPAAGPLPASWGWTVLLLGTVSAVIGVLLALQQHDLKRLLAFHSVENVGIILIGAGVAMLLGGGRGPPRARHAGPGGGAPAHAQPRRVQGAALPRRGQRPRRTGVRNMEELGGLARRMPWTAWLFLLGAVAISALPPLNGFVSEWMTFQALLLGGARLGGASGLLAGVAASMLALTGGLAAACFAKAFGVTFLGRPRSAHAEHATESPAPMIAGMLLLAVACVALGLAPGYAMRLLDRPTAELLGGAGASAVVTAQRSARPLGRRRGGRPGRHLDLGDRRRRALRPPRRRSPGSSAAGRAHAPRRLAPTWTCGMTPTSRFDYTGDRVRQAAPPHLRGALPSAPGDPEGDRSVALRDPAAPLHRRGGRPRRDRALRAGASTGSPRARTPSAPTAPGASTATSASSS